MKPVVPKDPNIYAPVVEYGDPSQNIVARPLWRNTLRDYKPEFVRKIQMAKEAVKGAWN